MARSLLGLALLAFSVSAQTIVLQAESGTLNGVNVDTSTPGFTGTGFVSGFDQSTDSVTCSFNVTKVLSEITILTASRTLQGREVRSKITKEYAQVYSDLDGGFTPLHWMFPNLPLESYRKRDAAHKKISDLYVSIIRARRENPDQEEEHDMISSLMGQKYRAGRALKDHEIAHIMIALLMAGQHNTSAVLSWCLLHIASDKQVACVPNWTRDGIFADDVSPEMLCIKNSSTDSPTPTARCER